MYGVNFFQMRLIRRKNNKSIKDDNILMQIREMQIKATTRFHFARIRTVTIKQYINKQCWRGCVGTGILA